MQLALLQPPYQTQQTSLSARLLSLLFVTFLASACSPGYYIQAGWEQASILLAREDISEVLEDRQASPETKEKLELVLDVHRWTQEQGFHQSESYTTYADIGREELVWVLSACPRNSFEPKTWWFPIVGTLPYKGFFDKDRAETEAKQLEEEGYDTYLRESLAYSTLGWFDDPVLSTMLKADKNGLANTLIHEIFHQTVWIPGHADFNESLANVIGGLGAKLYFAEKGDEINLEKAKYNYERLPKVANFYHELKIELEKAYSTEGDRQEIYDKVLKKWDIDKARFGPEVNNAQIIGRLTYLKNIDDLYSLVNSCEEEMACIIKKAKDIAGSKKNPWKLIQAKPSQD